MLADGDPGDRAQVGRVEDVHRPAGPVGDEELVAADGEGDVVGPASRLGRLELFLGLGIEAVEGSVIDVQAVEDIAPGIESQPAAEMGFRPRRGVLASALGSVPWKSV